MSQQIIPKRLSISSSYSSFIDSPRIIATPLRFKNPLRNQNKKVSITIPKLDNSNDQNDINFQSERIRKNFNNKFMKSPTLSPSKFIKIPSSASDNQKIISSIKGTSSYKTVKFKAELNEIEEDGDHDYLLGNMGKSLIRNKKHLRSKTEKYAENNNVNPYVSNTPKDFVKSQFNYDPNFKKTFESFINGKTDMKSLMNIKNFPSLFKFNENEQNKLTNISLLPKPKIGSLTERKFIKKNEEKKEESLSNTSKDKKINESLKDVSSTKNTALRHFDQIKEIVQKRLMLKKKIKNEAFEVNDWNVKFFQNFYSITKEYIEKIKKKDIITVNVKKNYYDKDYPTSQRLMKNFTFMNYTKSPKTYSKSINIRDTIKQSKQINQDYLKLNADTFLALLNKDVQKKIQLKEKNIISVPHLSHSLKKIVKPDESLIEDMFESNNNNEKEIFERNNEVKKSDLLQSETSNEETKQISPVVLSDRKSRVFVKKDLNTKRDQRLKEYINYQEDLDFFVKYNNSSDTGLFLNEISKLENFNDNYISRNLQNLQKDEVNFLNDLPALKAKIKYENMKREYEEKKRNKDVSKKNKRNNREERYYEIKRNVCSVNKNSKDLHELSEDDTSLPSLTEATLDGLYTESLDIQRKIIKKKDSGFAPRIKQFLKLEEISNSVEEANKHKLK